MYLIEDFNYVNWKTLSKFSDIFSKILCDLKNKIYKLEILRKIIIKNFIYLSLNIDKKRNKILKKIYSFKKKKRLYDILMIIEHKNL